MNVKRSLFLFLGLTGVFLVLSSGQARLPQPAEAAESVRPAAASLASTWSRLYLVDKNRYNYLSAVVEAFDGGFLIGGESGPGTAVSPCLVKVSGTGSVQWARSMSTTIKSLAKTADGKYVALGSAGTGSTADLVVFKFDDSCAVDWAYAYGGAKAETPGMIRLCDDGGFLVSAASNSFAGAGNDLWVLKLSSTGAILRQWAIGGASNEGAGFALETPDGGCFAATDTTTFTEGGNDTWLVKFDAAGAVEWQKSIGSIYTENPSGAVITPQGEFIVTSFTNSFTKTADAHLLKLSADGKLIWQKVFGGDWGEATNSIYPTDDGNYIVFGNQSSWPLTVFSGWAFKMTPEGSILWQRAFAGRGMNKCLRASNGDLIITEPFGTSEQYAIRDIVFYRAAPNGDLASACNETWTTSCVPVDSSYVLRDTAATPYSTDAAVASASVTFSGALPMIARDPCQTYIEQPSAPLNLVLARSVSRGVFRGEAVHTLTWQASSDNPRAPSTANYRIYRKMAGQGDSAYQRIGTVSGTILTYSDSAPSLTDRYVYAVAAVTSDGIEGPMSAPVGN